MRTLTSARGRGFSCESLQRAGSRAHRGIYIVRKSTPVQGTASPPLTPPPPPALSDVRVPPPDPVPSASIPSAPATSAPATSAPATSAPATSAPATSAPATSAPSTSARATSTSTVADLDAQRFRLHSSVHVWQQRASRVTAAVTNHQDTDGPPGRTLAEVVPHLLQPDVLSDPQRAVHYLYHLARHIGFNGLGFAGFAAHHISERLSTPASAPPGGSNPQQPRTPFERLMADAEPELAGRLSDWSAAVHQDYAGIEAGAYPLPWDMTTPGHRQYNPVFVAQGAALYVTEWIKITQRRLAKTPDPVWLQGGGLYPQYYSSTFHFQTDGWFSERSARVYEHSTEALFAGTQDMMQRSALLPIAEYIREQAQVSGRQAGELRLLEVAAGTGRFHTFVKDAYPELRTVVSDLSPFYLARARDNVRYWKSARQPGRHLGGVDDTGTEFLQTAAEAIAAPDESFDILLCVYLFHELPEAVRRRAVAEFARVLRPGGLVVLTDSVQLGDRPGLDGFIDVFGDFNEPYYRSYLSCDLGAMAEEAGLVCESKVLSMVTKTLSFRKPTA